MFRSAPPALWRLEAFATLALGWPLILTQVAQMALATTDVLLLGRLGPEAVAAGALAVNLYNAFMLFGVGVMTATMPMVARERGRMRHSVRDVRRTFRQALWVACGLAVLAWAVLWNGEAICLALGQSAELSRDAAKLLRVLMWSLLPFYAYVGLRSFLAAMERPMWSLVVGLVAVPVNAAVGWVLIFGEFGAPELGIVGAGWATVATNGFMFAALAVVLVRDRRFRRYRLFGRFWRFDGVRTVDFLRLGLPIGLMIAFESTVFNAAAFLAGLLGTPTLAAHAVTLQIAATAFMVPLGLSQAVTVRVGIAYGRDDAVGVAVAGWTGFGLVLAFMCTTATIMVTMPRLLVGAFIDPTVPGGAETFDLALAFLRLAALFQIVDGVQAVGAGMLRGRHDTRVPMIIALVGYWGIGLVASIVLAFPLGFAGRGIWMGLALGLGTVAVMLMVRWIQLTRNPRHGIV